MVEHRRTWDGDPIAPVAPYGAMAVVYRQGHDGLEVLVLHRAADGPDHTGDWAWTPPSGARLPGEPVRDCAVRELAEETGMRLTVREVPDGDDEWVLFTAEAPSDAEVRLDAEHDRYRWVPPEEAAELCAPRKVSGAIRHAIRHILDSTQSTQDDWNCRTRVLLQDAYLYAEDVRAGSGFRGDGERWRRAREPIVEALGRDGTLLDAGCANGLLMESLAAWAAEKGVTIEPFGLELLPPLAEIARQRLPSWSDRIFVGDVTSWEPPHPFDYVRIGLDYAPPRARRELVERCLNDHVAPGGRLVVCSYGSARRPEPRAEPVADLLDGWGLNVAGRSSATDLHGAVITRVAWTDRPH